MREGGYEGRRASILFFIFYFNYPGTAQASQGIPGLPLTSIEELSSIQSLHYHKPRCMMVMR